MSNSEVKKFIEIDPRYGWVITLTTFFFLIFLSRFIRLFKMPKAIAISDQWKWHNLLISWLHALIVGTWVLSSFILYPDLTSDFIEWANYPTYYCVSVSTGYFLYDCYDMVVNNQVLKQWELSLHHLAVTSTFAYNVVTGKCIAINMVALLAEVNSFFLHSRKLLQMLKVDFDNSFYRFITVLNIVTFAIFRGISLGSVTYSMYAYRERVPDLYYYTLIVAMFIMNTIHPVLFWRLLYNDFIRGRSKKSLKGGAGSGTSDFYTNGILENVSKDYSPPTPRTARNTSNNNLKSS